MNPNKLHLFVCPICKGELNWKISEYRNNTIMTGEACCQMCGKIYPVNDSITIFLDPKIQDMRIWERSERNMSGKNIKHQKCIENNNNSWGILQQIGIIENRNIQDTAGYYKEYFEKLGMLETMTNFFHMIDFCVQLLPRKEHVILDIASGKGLLINEIIQKTKNEVIVSDINPLILRKNRECNQLYGNERVCFTAFDINSSPFRDGSIEIVTTLFGLQNINKLNKSVEEIRRICSGKFLSISSFLLDEGIKNKENIDCLKAHHCEDAWLKSRFLQLFYSYGFRYQELFAINENSHGIRKEDIETRFAVMKFPIKDTVLEYNLSEFY